MFKQPSETSGYDHWVSSGRICIRTENPVVVIGHRQDQTRARNGIETERNMGFILTWTDEKRIDGN